VLDEQALDALQTLRNEMGPLIINSGTRCNVHNEKEGGKPSSEHLKGRAFDISLIGHDRGRLLGAAKKSGFRGFGFGMGFLHVDTGRSRSWDYGPGSRAAWSNIRRIYGV